MEGRDVGTIVFPDAEVKIFLTAKAEERAKRRWQELIQRGEDVELQKVIDEVSERDDRDASRDVAPLKPASDAVIFDTSALGLDAVVKELVELVRQRVGAS